MASLEKAVYAIGWLENHFEKETFRSEEYRADGLKQVEAIESFRKKQSNENSELTVKAQESENEIARLKSAPSTEAVFGTGGRKWQDLVELQLDENGTCFVVMKPQDLSDEVVAGSAYLLDGQATVEIKENIVIPLTYWTAILKCLQENAHRLPALSQF